MDGLSNRRIAEILAAHMATARSMEALEPELIRATQVLIEALGSGGRVFTCGNGGSAADAQHISAEFTGRLSRERRPLDVQALTTNSSALTAIGNDYSMTETFARQVMAHGRPRDVLIVISTSGNSENVLRAAKVAREIGMRVVGLTGSSGGALESLCDVCLRIPSQDTQRIQEMHILAGHILCELVEGSLCSSKP